MQVAGVRMPVGQPGDLVHVGPLRQPFVLQPDPLGVQSGPGGSEHLHPGLPAQLGQPAGVPRGRRRLGRAAGGQGQRQQPDRGLQVMVEPGQRPIGVIGRRLRVILVGGPDCEPEPGAGQVTGPLVARHAIRHGLERQRLGLTSDRCEQVAHRLDLGQPGGRQISPVQAGQCHRRLGQPGGSLALAELHQGADLLHGGLHPVERHGAPVLLPDRFDVGRPVVRQLIRGPAEHLFLQLPQLDLVVVLAALDPHRRPVHRSAGALLHQGHRPGQVTVGAGGQLRIAPPAELGPGGEHQRIHRRVADIVGQRLHPAERLPGVSTVQRGLGEQRVVQQQSHIGPAVPLGNAQAAPDGGDAGAGLGGLDQPVGLDLRRRPGDARTLAIHVRPVLPLTAPRPVCRSLLELPQSA